MTTVDAMADEIMKGLTEYADLADTSMKKAVRKNCKVCKRRNIRQCSKENRCVFKKLDCQKDKGKQPFS